ncbi:hypothetical protein MIMGU_mgv1a020750mg [Erythranthe guttata]|uniref:Ubiquitin-like domain-containing protein n=1 Tax=Erythranthe guttata TaxID=4155 RepID=A0A022RH12_ERYGU|nr:hypothetical protein MIMGU_mgv1a020750mg [Erythranthe guttata]
MAAAGAQRVKEEKSEIIILNIQYNETGGQKYSFSTFTDVPLKEIFRKFCNNQDLIYGSIRFMIDGDRIRETQTPRDLKLEDGDLIDAFNDQIGGGCW